MVRLGKRFKQPPRSRVSKAFNKFLDRVEENTLDIRDISPRDFFLAGWEARGKADRKRLTV